MISAYLNAAILLFVMLQATPPTGVWGWLLNQVPVVVVMGIIIWKQDLSISGYKKDLKEQSKTHREALAEKDQRLNEVANKALTVASLYDVKSDIISKENTQIINVCNEIRDMVRDINNNKG